MQKYKIKSHRKRVFIPWIKTSKSFIHRSDHRVYRFQLVLKKFPNSHIVRNAGKNLHCQIHSAELHHLNYEQGKATVERPQNIKLFPAKNLTSPRMECKYVVKTDLDNAQINGSYKIT